MSGEIERRGEVAAAPQARRYRAQAAELVPEWVMVGCDVPAGKRLYASQELKGTAFTLAVDAHMNGEGWNLATVMRQMLVITRPTYSECLAELMRIWQNRAGEGRQLPPESSRAEGLSPLS